jgi:hypothetical protein
MYVFAIGHRLYQQHPEILGVYECSVPEVQGCRLSHSARQKGFKHKFENTILNVADLCFLQTASLVYPS